MIQQKKWRSRVIGAIAVLSIAIFAGIGYYQTRISDGIRPYEASRDRAFIIDLFKKDWYWLISDYSPEYNVEFMLDYKAPTTIDDSTVGKLIIQTMVVDGKPVGFVTYYELDLKIAQLLFLGVGQEYRGKGYARKLMNFAIEDIKKRGLLGIRMNTRADNVRAQKLYDSLGFKKIWTDGAYIIYELIF